MPRSPGFLGSSYRSRSKNFADQLLINLYPEIAETKSGKEIGAFYQTPGLTLLQALTGGANRPGGLHTVTTTGTLYAVIGNTVWSVTSALVATNLGTIGTSSGPVSIIDNGQQVAIFDGVGGWLTPGGLPLTGGTIASGGGIGNAIGDQITLTPTGGQQSSTAIITVENVSATGAVTAFGVSSPGSFVTEPTGFTQNSTTGNGTGFAITAPTFGAAVNLIPIVLPFPTPGYATYQDGFGLVAQLGTDVFWQSNLFDLSVWDPLNFSSADSQPGNIQAMVSIHQEIWILKPTTTEIWVNAGLTGFAFQRLQGVFVEAGIVAPESLRKIGETLVWLARNSQGQDVVIQCAGYKPGAVSTQAIDFAMEQYQITSDAVAYAYQQEGHVFYVITFPSGNATWALDFTASTLAGFPVWHQRAAFVNGQLNREWATNFAMFNGQPVVGDYRNGRLYTLDLDSPTDNGSQRKWVRSWRALPKPTDDPTRFSSLRLDMETGGLVTPPGTNPQVVLQWSDDGGHTWSNEYFRSVGKIGQTALRVKWNRLGSTRRNSGLDRIFKVSSSDVFKVALIGVELEP